METGRNLIVVTGATGKQGGATTRELLAKGHKVRAVTRKPDSPAAREIAKLGAEVVAGDLDDAASLERSLAGAWGVFAVQNTWEAGVEREEEQGKRIAEIARRQGLQHYVYSSVASAHRNTGIPHFDNKWRVEEKVRALGIPSYTVLRPVFFMENLLLPSFLQGIQQGQLAVALEPATAEILSRVAQHEVKFVQVPIEEVRKFSMDYALMLEWFDRVGYDADIAKASAESGIRPTPLATWAATVDWEPARVTT